MKSLKSALLFRVTFGVVVCALVAACQDPFGIVEVCTTELRFEVTPRTASIRVGEALQASARASTCGGEKELESAIRWTTADSSVAIVGSLTGRVVGITAGQVRITAHDEGPYGAGPAWLTLTVEP